MNNQMITALFKVFICIFMAIGNIVYLEVKISHANLMSTAAQNIKNDNVRQIETQKLVKQKQNTDLMLWPIDTKKLILPSELIKKNGAPCPFEKEWQNLKIKSETFLREYSKQVPFKGFYLRGDGSQDFQENDSKYGLKLEWNLFKHGRYEMSKDLKKEKQQNEVRVLQLLKTMHEKYYNHKLDTIDDLRRTIHFLKAQELSDALAIIVVRRQEQLNNGYITKDDFDYIQNKYKQVLLEKSLYETDNQVKITKSVYDLLNCSEFIKFKDIAEIKKKAYDESYSLRIQNILIQRPYYRKNWFDDFTLNLFVERSKDFEDDHNNVGVNIKLPIHYYSKRTKLIESEIELFKRQANVFKLRIAKNIENLFESIKLHQYRIKKISLEHERIQKKIHYERQRSQKPLEDLKYTPERSLEMLILEEVNLCFEVLIARLKIFEILTKILEITHANHPSELIVDPHNSCCDQSATPNVNPNQ